MIFLGGKAVNTIRGADPRALTNAVEAAVKSAPVIKQIYSTPGRTLGGPGIKPAQSLHRPVSATLQSWFQAIIAFFGLYFITLFSVRKILSFLWDVVDSVTQLDSYAAGENSQFNIHRVPPQPQVASTTGSARPAAPPARKVGTLSDITGQA